MQEIIENQNEHKTRLVVVLTAVTMVVEIGFGYYTNSMALLVDGWHMLSHTFALGLTWFAYVAARKYSNNGHISFSRDKLLALSGFFSAIILQVIAVIMAIEAVLRLIHPLQIKFAEAIFVAFIGLIVSALSAVLLHHDHKHRDRISVQLTCMCFNLYSFDVISRIISSLVITKWSVSLIRDSGKVLIDFKKIS